MPHRTALLLAALALPPFPAAARAQAEARPPPELGRRIAAELKALTQAYAPFHAGLKDRRPAETAKKLASVTAAVDGASELLGEMAALRERAGLDPSAASDTAAVLLEIKAALEEADDDRRELRQEIKSFGKFLETQTAEIPRDKITAFRHAISRPYKDLYWNLQQLKERFESLAKPP